MIKNFQYSQEYLRGLLNAFPSPVLIVDRDLRIHDANAAAQTLIEDGTDISLHRLCGDLMHCLYARQSVNGCGKTEHCRDCVLRQTAETLKTGQTVSRRIAQMYLHKKDRISKTWFLVSGASFQFEGKDLIIVTLEDVTEIARLRRIVPMCSVCRKVRDDREYWHEVEQYLNDHTSIQFSHSICPACAAEFYPDYDL